MVVVVGLLGAQMEMCKTRNRGFTEGMGARHDGGRGGAAALKSGQVGPLDLWFHGPVHGRRDRLGG